MSNRCGACDYWEGVPSETKALSGNLANRDLPGTCYVDPPNTIPVNSGGRMGSAIIERQIPGTRHACARFKVREG